MTYPAGPKTDLAFDGVAMDTPGRSASPPLDLFHSGMSLAASEACHMHAVQRVACSPKSPTADVLSASGRDLSASGRVSGRIGASVGSVTRRASIGLGKMAGAVRRASVEIRRASIELTQSSMEQFNSSPREKGTTAAVSDGDSKDRKKSSRRLTAFNSFVLKTPRSAMMEEVDEQIETKDVSRMSLGRFEFRWQLSMTVIQLYTLFAFPMYCGELKGPQDLLLLLHLTLEIFAVSDIILRARWAWHLGIIRRYPTISAELEQLTKRQSTKTRSQSTVLANIISRIYDYSNLSGPMHSSAQCRLS